MEVPMSQRAMSGRSAGGLGFADAVLDAGVLTVAQFQADQTGMNRQLAQQPARMRT
jgi:hypothetical protein